MNLWIKMVTIQYNQVVYDNVDNVIKYYKSIVSKYPIKSIEDPFGEE